VHARRHKGKRPATPPPPASSGAKRTNSFLLDRTRQKALARGDEVQPELAPGHAVDTITQYARARGHHLIAIGHAAASR
jgi:hypothetical protein